MINLTMLTLIMMMRQIHSNPIIYTAFVETLALTQHQYVLI